MSNKCGGVKVHVEQGSHSTQGQVQIHQSPFLCPHPMLVSGTHLETRVLGLLRKFYAAGKVDKSAALHPVAKVKAALVKQRPVVRKVGYGGGHARWGTGQDGGGHARWGTGWDGVEGDGGHGHAGDNCGKSLMCA